MTKLLRISLLTNNKTAVSHNFGLAEVYFILEGFFPFIETWKHLKKRKQFHQKRSDRFLRVTISGLEKDFLAVAFSSHIFIKLRKARYGLGDSD